METETPGLWPYQQEAVEYALRTRRCFIALEMGGGKTVIGLAVARRTAAAVTIIFCQRIMKAVWETHVRTWLPEATVQVLNAGDEVIPGRSVYILNYALIDGNITDRKKKKNGVKVENSEAAKKRGAKARILVNALIRLRANLVIADESTHLKNKKAFRTKAATKIATNAETRLALTGTPLDNGPMDFVAQLYFLDQIDRFGGEWLFKKRYAVKHHHTGDIQTCKQVSCKSPLAWKARSFCPGCSGWETCLCGQNVWGYWEFCADNLMELNAKLEMHCYFRRTKSQVQPYLPKFRREIVPIEIDRKEYDAAVADFIEWMRARRGEDAAERAYRAEAIVKMEVLKQLVAREKLDAVVEWVSDMLKSGEKVVVFAIHKQIIEELSNSLGGYEPMIIDGGVDDDDRQARIKLFQENPAFKLMIVNTKTGKQGIDLTAAAECVFLEMEWTPTVHSQAESRLHRHGQLRPVTSWYLVGKDTIDERILSVLSRKQRVIDAAVDGKTSEGNFVESDIDVEMEVAKEMTA